MDFDVEIVHSAAEVGQEQWDRLGAGHAFASYRWYRFGEAVMAGETPIYIILSHSGEAVARATFWLARREPLPVASKMLRCLAQTALRRWPPMLCRSPLANISGLILPGPPLRDAAFRTLIRVAQEQARRHRASFLAFDFLEHDQARWPAWPGGFTRIEVPDPGTRLCIAWTDFECYLQHLSAKTRKNYRRNCRQAHDLGIEVKERRATTDIDRALPLIRSVETKHNSAPNPWVHGMLAHAGMVDSVWLAAEIAGRLVGCELMLGDRDVWFVTALGRDYDTPLVYFLLGYADIERAIQEKVRVLRWGSGAYETKQRLGFELEPNNHMTFMPNSRGLRWLARRLSP
ncbi:MAG: GNAT family N-acetyltransferase [Anaerolineae bacterium]|nr:GNAT family N-acetyltransferase [Anaerolineae bacterium]